MQLALLSLPYVEDAESAPSPIFFVRSVSKLVPILAYAQLMSEEPHVVLMVCHYGEH